MSRAGDRLYRLLLRAFPPGLRRAHGDEMAQLFARLREAEAGRPLALIGLWMRATWDVLRQGFAARWRRPPVSATPAPQDDAGFSAASSQRRRSRGLPAWDVLAQDLRVAVRGLLRRPVSTVVAALILAIGLGANTTIFAVVHGVLLRPLSYPDADALVMVDVAPTTANPQPGSMSYPDLADLRGGEVFESLLGLNATNVTLTGRGDPVILQVSRVTEGVLSTFGATPWRGRDIRPEEFGPGGPRVVVLGHALWQERFGGIDAIGESATLNGTAYEIVGIAPPGFEFPGRVAAWIPRALDVADCGRGCHTMQAVGRLAPGVTFEAARESVERAGASLEQVYPDTNTGKRFLVRRLKDVLVGNVEAGLWITFASAVLVLLVTCANVAGLQLAQACAREGDAAVRAALGASRARLASQVLIESAVLASIGAAGGVAVAVAGVGAFRRLAGVSIPRADLVSLDTTVFVMLFASVVAVMMLFSLLPALSVARTSISGVLSRLGRGDAARASGIGVRRWLLAGEVALSASLLIGAGLLLRTVSELHAVSVGFETREVVRFSVVLPAADYPDLDRAVAFYDTLEDQVSALPGVEAVGAMFGPPLGSGYATGGVLIHGRPDPEPGNEPEASVRAVTPGLLSTLQIPLRRGRLLNPADNRRDAEPVALVNDAFVRAHFPGQDPIGQRVRVTVDLGFGSPEWRIVGVVGDVRFRSLTEEAGADIYLPHAQFGPLSLTVHARLAPGAPPVFGPAREIVSRLDRNVPVYRAESLDQVLDRATAPARLYLVVVALFAVTAAVLAAVGLYGVMSQTVVQRTREIGLRLALGAGRENVISLVVFQGLGPVFVGLLVGVGGAVAGASYLESVLYGVSPRDPLVFWLATILMGLVALVAAALPAMKASSVDPSVALRGQ